MKRLHFFLLILLNYQVTFGSKVGEPNADYCTIDGECGRNNDASSKYLADDEESFKKFSRNLMHQITSAQAKYEQCEAQNCSCFFKQIEDDLSPYHQGISKRMIENVRQYGVKYQIINHKIYRQKDCMFPARCNGIEYFLKKNLNRLNDTELIINCRDWPQIQIDRGVHGPVFSFSKTDRYHDIMYPAWSFWEGGPAISTYPTGLGRWDLMREKLNRAADKHPWLQKNNRAFFRGSRTSDERDSLVLLSRKFPHLVEAQYTKNQAWKSMADTLGAEPVNDIPMENHCDYKYLFNFRGVAASFRFRHLFLCKSLVINVGDEWKEFFYDALVPNYHFIQVPGYPKEDDLRYLLRFLAENDELAQNIAQRGFEAIHEMLDMKDIHCYWHKLLTEYTKFLKFKVIRDDELIEIRNTK